MNNWISNHLMRLSAGLLTILGFSVITSCKDNMSVEYGTPHANFRLKGKVLNSENKPIKKIQLDVFSGYNNEIGQSFLPNPILSNDAGEFILEYSGFPEMKQVLICTDIDGEDNGSFINDTTMIEFKKDDFFDKGDGRWNKGAAKKEITITLKSK